MEKQCKNPIFIFVFRKEFFFQILGKLKIISDDFHNRPTNSKVEHKPIYFEFP